MIGSSSWLVEEAAVVQPFITGASSGNTLPGQPPEPPHGHGHGGGSCLLGTRPVTRSSINEGFEDFVRVELNEINRKLDHIFDTDYWGAKRRPHGSRDKERKKTTKWDAFFKATPSMDSHHSGHLFRGFRGSVPRTDHGSDIQMVDVTHDVSASRGTEPSEYTGHGGRRSSIISGEDYLSRLVSGPSELKSPRSPIQAPTGQVPVLPDRVIPPAGSPAAAPKFATRCGSQDLVEILANPPKLHRAKTVKGLSRESSKLSGLREIAKGGDTGSRDDPGDRPGDDEEEQTRMGSKGSYHRKKRLTVKGRAYDCGGWLDAVWNFLENPESGHAATWYAKFMTVFIMATVFVTISQTFEDPLLDGVEAAVVETCIDLVFLTEFSIRFLSCPNQRAFFIVPFNLIDLAATAPLIVRISVGFTLDLDEQREYDFSEAFLLLFVPIIRLMKVLRRFEKLQLLVKAFVRAFEALPVLFFMMGVICLCGSVLLFLAEERGNIPSLPISVWCIIVTMTTVGYGDIVPLNPQGRAVTTLVVVVTMLYMAVPLGIVGSAFNETWQDRDRILLVQRTRDRLQQWGYGASDIPVLFSLSDNDADGEITFAEFKTLINGMNIGFSEERIFQLFQSFDKDGSGTIDDKEFVKALFPHAYLELYGSDE